MLIDIIKNITDKVKNSSVSFIDMNLLTNNSWFLITEEVLNSKKIYIFKSNGQLLISINGDVIKGSWEILLHATNSLLIEHQDKSEMFNVSFLTNDFLILQKDGTESFTAFVKQEKYNAGVSLNGELKHYENMLSDLKEILNAPNHSTSGVKKISAIPKNERKNEKIFLETQTKEIDLDKMSLTLSESGLYYIFDEFKELENRKINGEIITSDDEIDFLVSVQLLKDELFQSNELCPKCNALNSIINGECENCLFHYRIKQKQKFENLGFNSIITDELILYKIDFENKNFIYGKFRYDKATDAINYAKLCNEKKKY